MISETLDEIEINLCINTGLVGFPFNVLFSGLMPHSCVCWYIFMSQRILCCDCLCLAYPMLPVSLYFPCLITLSMYSLTFISTGSLMVYSLILPFS